MPEKKRIFSREELEEFSKDFMGLTMEALEAGDLDKVKYWIRRQDKTKDIIHDAFLHWITALLSHIYDKYGEDAAVTAVKDTACYGQSGWAFPNLKIKKNLIDKQGIKGYIEWIVDMWRQHSAYPGLTVEEDDEKFVISMKQCGSGGRLINMGAYDGPFGYRKLKKAGPHTWGAENLPIYCAHCPLVHEIVPAFYDGEGAQLWIHASPFPQKPGDPCVHYVYKDHGNIPDEYYDRIGVTRKRKSLPRTMGIDREKNQASRWDTEEK